MTTTIIAAERAASVAALIARAAGAREPDDVAKLLSFEGRDDYLAFVAAWKAAYAAEAEAIRGHKRDRRDASLSDGARDAAASARHHGRERARGAIALRLAGKAIARAATARRPEAAAA